ncbi:translation initiation factor eIF-1A [Candidatus Woesearchaeota archaeon]|jgi:translation initiation factor 1A|nr:translation initiation factor eIF-1A [Candidatus Woesearchaeota archaeon]MBT4577083.1 translation initiation factor eIF-1A [Candidatus Woesearchaeota archaeon]MBT5215735.1 translation initiation factor eIF-1A [Candidatus Woesearchaeota archaeon]MBT6401837.1 translation initiation factor eIF-1A [Candidatus Woesearchaeota archaeon]
MPPFKKRTFKKPFKKKSGTVVPEEILRVRTPRGREVMGTIDQRLGGSKMRVKCMDGKTRLCRVPGRMKRRLWVREGDVVIIEPWELGGDEKGDLVYKYRPNQVQWLKKKGILKQIEEFEEF